jgi:hypothetical protein
VLAHPEIVVRAPHRHLASDAVIERAGKQAATPLEMGEGAVAPFRAKLIKTLFEEAFVIHLVASFLPPMFIAQKPPNCGRCGRRPFPGLLLFSPLLRYRRARGSSGS